MASARTGSGQAGRPAVPRITEDQYPDLYRKKCRGRTVQSLAREYGVDWSTMKLHLAKCHAIVGTAMMRSRLEVVDELDQIREAAWECFDRSKRPATTDEVQREIDTLVKEDGVEQELAAKIVKQKNKITNRDGNEQWLGLILACLDMESKLAGHYETGKREGQTPESKGKYRAAGRSPTATNQAMADRMHNLLSQRREALIGGSN